MQLKKLLASPIGNEAVETTIGIAGEISEMAEFSRFFTQPVDWHQREELLNGPGVGCRAEDR